MATFQFPDVPDLQKIANALGPWIRPRRDLVPQYVEKVLQVYFVDLKDLRSDKSARECLTDSGIWHIQILADDQAASFARGSKPHNQEGWNIHVVSGPSDAKAIANALDHVHDNFPDKYVVKILEIPAYFITALTLEDGDDIQVYIVDAAPGIGLEISSTYPFDRMRKILSTRDPVRGIIDPGDH